ncbi:hypothetical protein WQQ_43810 [Hydrocarboniphaga effusa AP103]|uniref:Uncharacterized protein n=1 Tax=Hydrocarboniphaga effusa AP103 TaxID=1172194 RepID=I8HX67_9GAMM|nr:hypothetical protein WQQ_43810 [Hydrocarboniphaga effusa AP103]
MTVSLAAAPVSIHRSVARPRKRSGVRALPQAPSLSKTRSRRAELR